MIKTLLSKFELGVWNIGVIEGGVDNLFEGKDYSIRWVKHKYHDRFFADPFLFKADNDYYYILAEELKFYSKKGIIVLLQVSKKSMRLISRTPIINEPYHLSYPNYDPVTQTIIPEANQSGALYSYQIAKDCLIKRKIADLPLIDPTFLSFADNNWVFATTKESAYSAKAQLRVFVNKDQTWDVIKQDPAKDDISSARPAGNFFEYQGELFRPAQDSTTRYGCKTHVMRVVKLNENEYKEEFAFSVEPDKKSKYRFGLHTFNVYNGFVLIDGYATRRELRKFFFVKTPNLCKKISDSDKGLAIVDYE